MTNCSKTLLGRYMRLDFLFVPLILLISSFGLMNMEFGLMSLKPRMQIPLWFAVCKWISITCCTRGYNNLTVHVDNNTICVHHIIQYVYT